MLRTYTIRTVDEDAREIAIDFVVHGDEGIAGPWAATVTPGSTVHFLGPGSGYRPDNDAAWHLLAADEAGLPALAAAVESLPEGAIAKAFIEVAGPEDEVALDVPSGVEITWVHRGGPAGEVPDDRAGDNAPLIAAVRETEWLDGEPHVFIHGEAQAVMHNLRGYVRKERGVSAARASWTTSRASVASPGSTLPPSTSSATTSRPQLSRRRSASNERTRVCRA